MAAVVQQAVRQTVQQAQAPQEAADQFQSLFDAGAFEPSTNETDEPTRPRLDPRSDQARQLQEEEGASAQTDADEPGNEPSEEDSASASAESKEEPEGPEYQSLDEFLTAHKIDPESFRGLNVPLKVNGETRMAPLAELIKNYQLESAITQKSQAFSQQQQAWEQERTATQTLYKQQLQQAHNLGQHAYNQLVGEYSQIPWDQLKAADPALWTQKQLEFSQRHQQISAHLQQIDQAQQAETQRSQQELLARLPKERERMLDLRPEWRDSKRFEADRAAMKAYGAKRGFSESELGGITDHRLMLILHDAASYAALQASAPETLKKVRAAPAMQAKPGARQGRDPRTVARTQAQERFMKNPRDTDAAAAYFETLVS